MADRGQTEVLSDAGRQQLGRAAEDAPKAAQRSLDQVTDGLAQSAGVTLPMATGPLNVPETDSGQAAGECENPLQDEQQGEMSIEQYMADLLARCGGHSKSAPQNDSGPTAARPAASRPGWSAGGAGRRAERPRSAAEQPPAGPAASGPHQADSGAADECSPAPRRSRPTPPERREDLSSMRDLANMNTRTSLHAHNGRALILELHGRQLMALLFLVSSFALLASTSTVHSISYFGAAIALITSMVWTIRCVKLGHRLNRLAQEVERDGQWQEATAHEQ